MTAGSLLMGFAYGTMFGAHAVVWTDPGFVVDSELGQYPGLVVATIAQVILLVAARRREQSFASLVRTCIIACLGFICLGLMLLSNLSVKTPLLSSAFTEAGIWLTVLTFCLICIDFSQRSQVDGLAVNAQGQFLYVAGVLAGKLASTTLCLGVMPSPGVLSVYSALVFAATAFVLLWFYRPRNIETLWGRVPVERDVAKSAGERSGAASGLEGGRPERRFDGIVDRVAREAGLTPREREILGYLARNFRMTQVTDELGISYSTVKTHVEHIYSKLDVHSQKELYRYMQEAKRKVR